MPEVLLPYMACISFHICIILTRQPCKTNLFN